MRIFNIWTHCTFSLGHDMDILIDNGAQNKEKFYHAYVPFTLKTGTVVCFSNNLFILV